MSTATLDSLLERDAEVGALRAALDAARTGRGGVVIVRGPPGIGKSRLLAGAREIAEELHMRPLTARGAELERSFSFGIVRQLVAPVYLESERDERDGWFSGAAALAAPLFEPDALVDELDDPTYARLHGLYWLCANLSQHRPLLLAVDDAQWADESSLAFLGFLARRISELAALLVVAIRIPDEGDHALRELLGDAAAVTLAPAPLGDGAVAELVTAAVGSEADPAFAAACREVTGGNPFLVEELAREIAVERIQPGAGDAGRVRSLGPAGVRAVTLVRLARLPRAATRLARALAVLGDGSSLAEVGALASLDEGAAGQAAIALEAGAIVERRDGLGFVHPILRSAIYEDIPSVERAAGHAAAARLLREAGAPLDRVAAQVLLTDPSGEPWVVDALQEAATGALAIGDPASAGAYVRRALAEQPPEAVRAALLSDLGLAEARNGAAEALEHLEQAATASDLHVRVTATRRLAGLMNFNAEASGTVALLERAIDTMPPDHELTATLHAELVGAAYTSLACHERLAGWIAGLPVPEGVPQTQLELFAVAARAYDQAVVEGDPQSALELAVRVASSPVISTDPVVGVQALVLVVVVLIVAERLEEAEAACAGVLADARAQGSGLGVSAASAGRAVVRARRGDLPGAEADGLAALELRPDHNGTRGRALEALGSALLAGVDLGRPVEELEALAGQAVRDPDLPTYSQLLIAEGALLMSQERHGEALERFRACDRPEPLWGRDCPALVPWRSGAALALARLGEADSAQRLAAEEAELARRAGTPRALGVALRAQALARGGADRADLLERAVESLEGARAPLELARALLDLGSARRRAGARTEARALLERAHGLAAGCGAAALVARAAEEIRSSGARLKRAPAAGVEGLTPSERRVAELAAEGRSNREIAQALFLSEKTVETHLGSTYRKLGIRSRGKLPGALREPA